MFKPIFVLLALVTASLQAATILVSNVGESTRATTVVDIDLWAAQSFSTDANSYALVDIMTVLGAASGAPSVVAELRKDTTAGSLLTSFVLPDLTGPPSIRTLTPTAPVALDADTTYWLLFLVEGGGSFGWSYAEGNASVGPGSLPAFAYSRDQGATWGEFDATNPYKVQVNVENTGVPEPSTLLLGVTGLLAAVAVRLRRTHLT